MSRAGKILLVLLIAGPLAAGAGLAWAATAIVRAGTVAVDVVERDGSDIHVVLPAAFAGAAVALVPDDLLREAAEEAGPFLPAVSAGWDELERCPDFVLVEVRSSDESVRVAKEGRRLLIDVDSDGAKVRVAVPLNSVGSVISRLERAI